MTDTKYTPVETAIATVVAFPFAFVIIVLLAVYGAWVDAFVISKIWEWFIAPTGIAVPKFQVLFGAMFIVMCLHVSRNMPKKEYARYSDIHLLFNALLQPWVCLAAAYIARVYLYEV